jgi:threonine dehydrogenase-like Zn-dependent dehydrogenase
MKAAVLYDINTPLKIEDVTLDDPQENEILVKLEATGVCHSDLHFMQGDMPMPGEGGAMRNHRPARRPRNTHGDDLVREMQILSFR